MIIDFHSHIFPKKIAESTIKKLETMGGIPAYTNGTQENLRQSMKKAGISLCVNLPVQTNISQFDSINNFALKINEDINNYENKILSFGGIHPDMPNINERMTELKNKGFLGIKLHPEYQQTFIDDLKYYKILSKAKDLDMTVVIHAGFDVGFPDLIHCTPKLSSKVIDKLGGGKFVFAHMGGLLLWEDVKKYLVGKDCYFDMGVVFDQIKKQTAEEIINMHGSKKILFGTDSPWFDQEKAVALFNKYDLDRNQKEDILYKNAENLLNL